MSNQRRADKTSFAGFILKKQKAKILELANRHGAYQSDVLKAMAANYMALPKSKQRELLLNVMSSDD
jgi:hypothetical protein